MFQDIFLRLDGIKGEAQDQIRKDEIDVVAFNWAVDQVGVQNKDGGGGSGKTFVHDIVVLKLLDFATPALILNCVTGRHIKDGQITLRKVNGGKPLEFLKIKLEDILITNVSEELSGPDSEQIRESVSLNFSRFFVEYSEQDAGGAGKAGSLMGYDIKANTKL